MKAQTRKGSAVETGVNLVVGFALSWAINYWCLPLFGMQPSIGALWGLGGIFTAASIVRQFFLRRLFEALRIRKAPPEFLDIAMDLAAERERQIGSEGHTLAHDDAHAQGEIAMGACAYAFSAAKQFASGGQGQWLRHAEALWPWDADSFRPTHARRDLVKAGAMIIAEIGRIDRRNARRGCE